MSRARGREGELIFAYLYELSGCKKPHAAGSMQSGVLLEGLLTLRLTG